MAPTGQTAHVVRRRLGRGAVLAVVLLALPIAEAHATIVVANTNDSGVGSLRRAVLDASSGETVSVPAGTYALTSAELLVNKSLTLAGAGRGATVVRAAGPFRVLHVTGSASTVRVADLTIRDGRAAEAGGIASGGGVLGEDATLTLERVLVTGNSVSTNGTPAGPGGIAGGGGVASSSGSLALLDSHVTENVATATGGDAPGAIDGGPGGIVDGGGVASEGTLAVRGTTVSGNEASASGGLGGPGNDGGPGGIVRGGGVSVNPGSAPASIAESTIADDLAEALGGIGGGAGGVDGPGGSTRGGGLHVLASAGVIGLTNVTVTADISRTSPMGVAEGGGVYASTTAPAKVQVASSTLAGNTAAGGGLPSGGDLRPDAGVELRSTIITGGVASAGRQSCSAPATSLGHVLEATSPSQCGVGALTGDRVGIDPRLGVPKANGGDLRTLAPVPGSPAIDGGDAAQCPATDARGVLRPQGAGCDAGAVEVAPGRASTGAASALEATSATLSGSGANPDALAGSGQIEFGTTTAYGRSSTPRPLAPLGATAPFSVAVSGLSPATSYHFRAVVTNAAGTAVGADATFRTAASPGPPVTTPTTPAPGPPATTGTAPVVVTPPLAPAAPAGPLAPAPVAPSAGGPPVLGPITLTPRAIAPAGTRTAAGKPRRTGAQIRYTDSQRATTTLTLLRSRPGVRVGSRCVARRPASAAGRVRRCMRFARVGTLTHVDEPGVNRVRFSARVGGRRLPAGTYRMSAIARTAAGRASGAEVASFRVVR